MFSLSATSLLEFPARRSFKTSISKLLTSRPSSILEEISPVNKYLVLKIFANKNTVKDVKSRFS